MISPSKPPSSFNEGETDGAWRVTPCLLAPVNAAEGNPHPLSACYLGAGPFISSVLKEKEKTEEDASCVAHADDQARGHRQTKHI